MKKVTTPQAVDIDPLSTQHLLYSIREALSGTRKGMDNLTQTLNTITLKTATAYSAKDRKSIEELEKTDIYQLLKEDIEENDSMVLTKMVLHYVDAFFNSLLESGYIDYKMLDMKSGNMGVHFKMFTPEEYESEEQTAFREELHELIIEETKHRILTGDFVSLYRVEDDGKEEETFIIEEKPTGPVTLKYIRNITAGRIVDMAIKKKNQTLLYSFFMDANVGCLKYILRRYSNPKVKFAMNVFEAASDIVTDFYLDEYDLHLDNRIRDYQGGGEFNTYVSTCVINPLFKKIFGTDKTIKITSTENFNTYESEDSDQEETIDGLTFDELQELIDLVTPHIKNADYVEFMTIKLFCDYKFDRDIMKAMGMTDDQAKNAGVMKQRSVKKILQVAYEKIMDGSIHVSPTLQDIIANGVRKHNIKVKKNNKTKNQVPTNKTCL